MIRLIAKGLMFGDLVGVNPTAWMGRCNRALKKTTGRMTRLTEFPLDVSGGSPEIGDEPDDRGDLRPGGGSRQFILPTTEQKAARMPNRMIEQARQTGGGRRPVHPAHRGVHVVRSAGPAAMVLGLIPGGHGAPLDVAGFQTRWGRLR